MADSNSNCSYVTHLNPTFPLGTRLFWVCTHAGMCLSCVGGICYQVNVTVLFSSQLSFVGFSFLFKISLNYFSF